MVRNGGIVVRKRTGGSRNSIWATLIVPFVVVWFSCCSIGLVEGQPAEFGFLEPGGQLRDPTFQVLEFDNGQINQVYDGTLRYYCTFRGKWSKVRHPADFPRMSSWGAPVMISHSDGYRMWTGTEAATLGVESIAEVRCVCLCSCFVSVSIQETILLCVNFDDEKHYTLTLTSCFPYPM